MAEAISFGAGVNSTAIRILRDALAAATARAERAERQRDSLLGAVTCEGNETPEEAAASLRSLADALTDCGWLRTASLMRAITYALDAIAEEET